MKYMKYKVHYSTQFRIERTCFDNIRNAKLSARKWCIMHLQATEPQAIIYKNDGSDYVLFHYKIVNGKIKEIS